MKRISSSIIRAVAKLGAVLVTIFGCSSKGVPDKPREIHWKGQETGYQGTTVIQPGDSADSDGKKQPNP